MPRSGLELWCASTWDCPYAALRDRFAPVLSQEERERETGFVFQADRHVFLLGHALLRLAVAEASDVEIERVDIRTREGGKPFTHGSVEFNLSHARTPSGGVAAVAVSREGPVGVDLEPITRADDLAELLASNYTTAERHMLAGCTTDVRAERMVWLWTAKEAVLKAIGAGLRNAPQSVEVSWDHAGVIRTEGWHLTRFRFREFLGTVATAKTPGEIQINLRAGSELAPTPAQDVVTVAVS